MSIKSIIILLVDNIRHILLWLLCEFYCKLYPYYKTPISSRKPSIVVLSRRWALPLLFLAYPRSERWFDRLYDASLTFSGGGCGIVVVLGFSAFSTSLRKFGYAFSIYVPGRLSYAFLENFYIFLTRQASRYRFSCQQETYHFLMKKSIQIQQKSSFTQGLPLCMHLNKWKERYMGKWLSLISPTFYLIIIDSKRKRNGLMGNYLAWVSWRILMSLVDWSEGLAVYILQAFVGHIFH